ARLDTGLCRRLLIGTLVSHFLWATPPIIPSSDSSTGFLPSLPVERGADARPAPRAAPKLGRRLRVRVVIQAFSYQFECRGAAHAALTMLRVRRRLAALNR